MKKSRNQEMTWDGAFAIVRNENHKATLIKRAQ